MTSHIQHYIQQQDESKDGELVHVPCDQGIGNDLEKNTEPEARPSTMTLST